MQRLRFTLFARRHRHRLTTVTCHSCGHFMLLDSAMRGTFQEAYLIDAFEGVHQEKRCGRISVSIPRDLERL